MRRFERYLDFNFFEHQVRPGAAAAGSNASLGQRRLCCCRLVAALGWPQPAGAAAPLASRPGRANCPISHPCTRPQIHWFSIFNSFMMVIFLTGLVSMILLRTLRRDYARYTQVPARLPAARHGTDGLPGSAVPQLVPLAVARLQRCMPARLGPLARRAVQAPSLLRGFTRCLVPTCLPACLLASSACLPPCLPAHLPARLPACPACCGWQRADHDDLESLERDMNEESGWKLVSLRGLGVRGSLEWGWGGFIRPAW